MSDFHCLPYVMPQLSGSHYPYVTELPDENMPENSLQQGDIIAAVNGRPAHGATAMARKIIGATEVNLTVWRPVVGRSRDGPLEIGLVA